MSSGKKVLIIGAGPAGLTAGLELINNGFDVTIVEAGDKVGGISRTEEFKGYKFDIGGHRFFSKNKEIEKLWEDILGEELLTRKRKSRILYNGKYFDYPLSFTNALKNLGIRKSSHALLSYLRYTINPITPENNYADWMTNRFGKVLFNTFFKTYTEKVWGIPVTQISTDWAEQRVKKLSLCSAVIDSIFKNNRSSLTTLIDEFRYPKYGPGQMWERVSETLEDRSAKLIFNFKVEQIESVSSSGFRVSGETTSPLRGTPPCQGGEFDHVISTMPLRSLIRSLENVPKSVTNSADQLKYRDFITVLLIINKKNVFSDNWIYIHDENVRVGRIQNFKNWSPYMVPDESKTSLGLEYFFFENDEFWNCPNEELLQKAKEEIVRLGICKQSDIEDGTVLRVKKAYPVYNANYKNEVKKIRKYLKSIPNLHVIGRNGMHKYNNQDHSMMTALIVARNIIAGEELKNPWKVNSEALYHESKFNSGKGRLVPRQIKSRRAR